MQQHIAREVEIFVVYTRQIFFANQLVKHFENRSTFAKVINKRKVAYFFETQCILVSRVAIKFVRWQHPAMGHGTRFAVHGNTYVSIYLYALSLATVFLRLFRLVNSICVCCA